MIKKSFFVLLISCSSISYPEELIDLGDIEDLIDFYSKNRLTDLNSDRSDLLDKFTISVEDSESDVVSVDSSEKCDIDLQDNLNDNFLEPPTKKQKTESFSEKKQLKKDDWSYTTLVNKFGRYNFKFSIRKCQDIYKKHENVVYDLRHMTYEYIWSTYTTLCKLIKDKCKSTNLDFLNFEIKTYLDKYLEDCINKTLEIFNYINKKGLKVDRIKYDEPDVKKNFHIKSINTNLFIKSNMKKKISFLRLYTKKISSHVIKKTQLFYSAEEFLRKRILKINGGIDVLIFKISYIRIISNRKPCKEYYRLISLIYILEVYYKDPFTIQNLCIEELNDLILIIYNIPCKSKGYNKLIEKYNFINILIRAEREVNDIKFYTYLFLLIIPIFMEKNDLIYVLENEDNLYKYLENNPDLFNLMKFYIQGLIKFAESIIN